MSTPKIQILGNFNQNIDELQQQMEGMQESAMVTNAAFTDKDNELQRQIDEHYNHLVNLFTAIGNLQNVDTQLGEQIKNEETKRIAKDDELKAQNENTLAFAQQVQQLVVNVHTTLQTQINEGNNKDADLQEQIDEVTGHTDTVYSTGFTLYEEDFGTMLYCDTCTDTEIIVPPIYDGVVIRGIGTSAFEGVPATSIVLPNTVEVICENAFDFCDNLTTITLGSGLKSIYGVFGSGSRGISDVICLAEDPPIWEKYGYDSVLERQIALHVLPQSVAKYQAAEGWSEFHIFALTDRDKAPPTDSLETLKVEIDNLKDNGGGGGSANYDDEINDLQSQINTIKATLNGFINVAEVGA